MKTQKKEFDLTAFDRKEAELHVQKTLIEFCIKQASYYAQEVENEAEYGVVEISDNYDLVRYQAFNAMAEKLMKEACK